MVLPTAPRARTRGAVVVPGQPGSTETTGSNSSTVQVAHGAAVGSALWSGENVSVGEKAGAGGSTESSGEDLGEGWDSLFGDGEPDVADVSVGPHGEDDEDYDPVHWERDEHGVLIPRYIPKGAASVAVDVYDEFFAEQEARAASARVAAEEAEAEEIEAERIALEQHNAAVIHDVISHPQLAPIRARISAPERRLGLALGILIAVVIGLGLVIGLRTITPTEEPEPTPTSIFMVDPGSLG